MRSLSLRARLLIAVISLAAAGLVLANVVTFTSLRSFLLDRADIGAADTVPQILPGRGAHRLRLVDLGGRVVDQLLFTVR